MDALSRQYHEAAAFAKRRYLSATARSSRMQADLLMRIVKENRDSTFAREHNFESVRTVADWRSRVPVRTYRELEPWCRRAAGGEHPVLTADLPVMFHRTSSTTGAPKLIPVTRAGALARFSNAPAHVASLLEHHPEVLDTVDATLALTVNRSAATTTSAGLPWCFFSETDWTRLQLTRHGGGPGARAPWLPIPPDIQDAHYARLRLALDSPLRAILSWFPASILQLSTMLTECGERLVKELREGTVCGRPSREPDPTRARQLEVVLGRGRSCTLHDVWPTLTVVECWMSATSRFYLQQLQACVGAEVDIFPCAYGSTETSIAFVADRASPAGLLDVTSAFFEFVPVDAAATEPLLHDQLECGKDYSLIVTTMSGLYRYALGDVVHVPGYVNSVPLVEFRYRQGVASSLIAEKLTEPQVTCAIEAALQVARLASAEAGLAPVYASPPHYLLLIDAGADDVDVARPAVAAAVDQALSQNVNYAFYRQSGLVTQPRVELMSRGTFAAWRTEQCETGRVAHSQQKPRAILSMAECQELHSVSERLRASERRVR